jgi:hypothetical protein
MEKVSIVGASDVSLADHHAQHQSRNPHQPQGHITPVGERLV